MTGNPKNTTQAFVWGREGECSWRTEGLSALKYFLNHHYLQPNHLKTMFSAETLFILNMKLYSYLWYKLELTLFMLPVFSFCWCEYCNISFPVRNGHMYMKNSNINFKSCRIPKVLETNVFHLTNVIYTLSLKFVYELEIYKYYWLFPQQEMPILWMHCWIVIQNQFLFHTRGAE